MKMIKFSNRFKVNFVKFWIIYTACWLVCCLYVGLFYDEFLMPVFFIYTLHGIIMVCLMGKVDISPTKVEPTIKRLNVKSYEEYKSIFFQEARIRGYKQEYSLRTEGLYDNTLAFKDMYNATVVLQTIWMEELNIQLLDIATQEFWSEAEKYLGKNKIAKREVNLIQCVCVQRMNADFKKYITQNVQQDYKRYQVLTAISFGGKKAYICRTKGGFYRSFYRGLLKEFDDIASSLWNVNETL